MPKATAKFRLEIEVDIERLMDTRGATEETESIIEAVEQEFSWLQESGIGITFGTLVPIEEE
jgi:hypothetical protein